MLVLVTISIMYLRKGSTMREGYVPFESEESESIRQELLAEANKREKSRVPERMSLEPSLSVQDSAVLAALLKTLPNYYRKAQFKMRKKKNYYDRQLTDYEFDLRYETKDGPFMDTFRISCVNHKKI